MTTHTLKRLSSEGLRALGWTVGAALGVLVAAAPPPSGAGTAQLGDDPRECLAVTLYFEAGGGEREDMEAVASVVLNRRAHYDFPPSVCEVVRQGGPEPGCQFSWWCDGRSDRPQDRDVWRQALAVTDAALRGRIDDATGGALFFHAADLETVPWRVPRERTVQIGRHIYYR